MSKLVIGLDGGGTSTAAVLARIEGAQVEPLGRGVSGPSNLLSTDATRVWTHIDQAIAAAFREARLQRSCVDVLCAAMAGSDRESVRRRILEWAEQSRCADVVRVVHDGAAVIAEVDLSQNAVGLISGTGALAFGRAADGRTARAGGWGPLLGDQGSAYWIGLEALRAAALAIDGRVSKSELFERLAESLAWGEDRDLPARVAAMSRESIAGLSVIVDQAAVSGDTGARLICQSAAVHLASLVPVVVRQLAMPADRFALVLAGGLLLNHSEVFRSLGDQLDRAGVRPESVSRCGDPAWGAVCLARRSLAMK